MKLRRLTNEQFDRMREEEAKMLEDYLKEDKVVKFGGETHPKFGWCVIMCGGSGVFLYLVEFDHYDNPEGCVVRETELTKRPKYYTAKIVCVDNHHLPHWQVGKIYHVTEGKLECDDVPSCNNLRYTNLTAINGTHFAQFIEVVD